MIVIKKNKLHFVGLGLILVSTLIFYFGENMSAGPGFFSKEGSFMVNYILALGYFFVSLINPSPGKKRFQIPRDNFILVLSLFFVSCFALNREFPIFQEAASWWSVAVCFTLFVFVLPVFVEFRHQYFKIGYAVAASFAVLVVLYYAISLVPYYGVGIFGVILMGIGPHVYVPIVMLVYFIIQLKQLLTNREMRLSFWGGVAFLFTSLVTYIILFNVSNNRFYDTYTEATKQTTIPRWVYMAQHLPEDNFTELHLKKTLIYPSFFFEFRDNPSTQEYAKHDPLIVIADQFIPRDKKAHLSVEETLRILRAGNDEHQNQEERLWSGDDLRTHEIVTEVETFPAYRMAYTQKTFWIKNTADYRRFRGDTQEAIYQFQLPEGTAVTSLSLWVEGKEEKAILTTKEKADSAYQTIVGRERRDPSLVTWKEGNMISMRVFPCTRETMRQVKIGFTSPLKVVEEKLQYEAISFEGPSPYGATEQITIYNDGEVQTAMLELSTEGNEHTYKGGYVPNWSFTIPKLALSTNPFCFQGNCYELGITTTVRQEISNETIYIDLTNSWEEEELESLLSKYSGKAYAFIDNEKFEITTDNMDQMLEKVEYRRFGLFPFHKLSEEFPVIVTKGGSYSAKLSELAESNFYEELGSWQKQHNAIVFLMGEKLTPYQKALQEFRAVKVIKGDMNEFIEQLKMGFFPVVREGQNWVQIPQAEMSVYKELGNKRTNASAPDHLMRLYSYNSILRDIGNKYMVTSKDDLIKEELVERARDANVVSPLSSLIVLETQKDYDRFDIKKGDGLENAAIQSSGAAPEPHEWLLIILLSGLLIYTVKQKYQVKWRA